MTSHVVVVDYGIGNVFSVCNALKKVGAQPELTRDRTAIKSAERLILPGVGAFGRAMDALREYGLDELLTNYIATGRPFLGICLGMQMLMDVSTEFGDHKGLGFIAGRVEKISTATADGQALRVPHINWATVERSAAVSDSDWKRSAVSDPSGGAGCF
jgi:glutamine amidotransferase